MCEKIAGCASAHKNGRLVEALGCGSSNVMGNLPIQKNRVIKKG